MKFQLHKYNLQKPTVNIMFNGEKLEALPPMSITRQRCPFPLLLFSILLTVFTNAISLEKEIKSIQIEKEDTSYLYWPMT